MFFYRNEKHLICDNKSYPLFNKSSICMFLSFDGKYYSCKAFGFRNVSSTYDGICFRKNLKNYYDHNLFIQEKNTNHKFCFYPVLVPLTFIINLIIVIFNKGWIINMIDFFRKNKNTT